MTSPPIPLRASLLANRGLTPDDFQVQAFEVIDDDRSVLVTAPTASGKTLIAEYAIAKALEDGRSVAYTTPIKALSNQKFRDLASWLGPDRVGLLTGDNAIRPEVDVVVMTTEVLRNMIYAGSPRLENLGLVVLDEVHFLQDPYRGPVWEEVIIQLPTSTRLVCLSATVTNAEELAGWISEVQGSCEAITEPTRPVELHDHFLVFDKRHRRLQEFRTLRNGQVNIEVERFLGKLGGERRQDGRGRSGGVGRPRRSEVIEHLDATDRLPAICFIFSRQGCDDAVRNCLEQGIGFLDGRERQQVETIAEQHVREIRRADLEVLDYESWLEGLKAGVAAHHAGMVAPFKETVEDCFAAGLLRVVFATETLAMGVNLPARSVVVEQLSRFRGEGHVVLTPGEYTQLTGRAGRRGIDSIGHAYTLWSPYESFDQIARLASSKEFVLESAFRPTYNMAANLMSRADRQEAIELLERSFAQYRSARSVVKLATQVEKAKASLRTAQTELKRLGVARSTETSPVVKGVTQVSEALGRLRPGVVVERIQGTDSQHLLVLGTTNRRGGDNRVRVVTARGKVMMLGVSDFDQSPQAIATLELPKPYAPNRREYQRVAARLLKQHLTDSGLVPEMRRPDRDLQRARADAERQVQRAELRIESLKSRIDLAEGGLTHTLDAIVAMLQEFGCATGWQLEESGERLQGIFHEMDLLVGICIDNDVFDGLSAQELAAITSVLTYEHRSRIDPPPPWYPNNGVEKRVKAMLAYATSLRSEEQARGLPETRMPDPSIFAQIHAWASGHDLSQILDDEISAGDFVRNVRQVIDLLSQIAEVVPNDQTRKALRNAVTAIDRDLVSAAARVQDDAEHEVDVNAN
jgi:ATP-dependent RNA helicase HelY